MPISGEADCQVCHAAARGRRQRPGTKAAVRHPLTVVRSKTRKTRARAAGGQRRVGHGQQHPALHDHKHMSTQLVDERPRPAGGLPALPLHAGAGSGAGRSERRQRPRPDQPQVHVQRDAQPPRAVKDVNGQPLFPAMPAPTADSATTGLPGNQRPARGRARRDLLHATRATRPSACAAPWPTAAWSARTATATWRRWATTSRGTSRPPTRAHSSLAADFYTNPNTPRVPWANEPGCGSCHTGDATSNLAATAGTIVNAYDTNGNADGIRLLQRLPQQRRQGDADRPDQQALRGARRSDELTASPTRGPATRSSTA